MQRDCSGQSFVLFFLKHSNSVDEDYLESMYRQSIAKHYGSAPAKGSKDREKEMWKERNWRKSGS